jgi:hypothetical protein
MFDCCCRGAETSENAIEDDAAQLIAEMRKQENTIDFKNASITNIARSLIDEVRAAGKDIAAFVTAAVQQQNGGHREARSLKG